MTGRHSGARLPGSAGLWAGGFFCFLAILSISLGLVPLIQAVLLTRKPVVTQIPGQEKISLRLPGTYFGVADLTAFSIEDKAKVQSMDYWLSDDKEKDYFKVNKFPPRNYYSGKEDSQAPLFEIVIAKKGDYILTSDYPIGTEGPKVQIFLYRYDAPHVWAELVVGVLMFLMIGGLGCFFIWKSLRASPSRPASPRLK